jgi:penicillin-binding protein 1C
VGNFSGEPMQDVSGVTGAAPVWLEVMSWLHRSGASRALMPPTGLVARTVSFPPGIEPDRVEWFLEGTEPQTAGQGLAASHPRILAPVSGTMVALDPDIPPSRQRMVFEAHPGGAPVGWVLDGTAMGAGTDLVIWSPQPGKHTLSLVDGGGLPLDTITFEVRGAVPASAN